MLEVRKIDAAYGDVRVLEGLSLEVHQGEIVTLLGSNGAGKTTTLRCICGVLPPKAGEVFFKGRPLSKTPAFQRTALGIAQVPEGRELWPQLTVRENLELGAYHEGARGKAAAALDRVNKLFPRLLERRTQMAGSLSGGEQQMCAIGRALMSEPSLLLLDEPSLGLAPIVVDQMFEVIRSLHASGMTILLVEQNLLAALEVATRGYVIETGKVTLQGTAAELSANTNIRAAYLGL
ncbi:MAG TPA: ABC transporter ATP-binding protein [Myxococcales bacterium]|jgi:branched-chain amino acid transport system ATP-binding protein|nr:ABC transporter ATP-binding protein [Myxococcales bacterium]